MRATIEADIPLGRTGQAFELAPLPRGGSWPWSGAVPGCHVLQRAHDARGVLRTSQGQRGEPACPAAMRTPARTAAQQTQRSIRRASGGPRLRAGIWRVAQAVQPERGDDRFQELIRIGVVRHPLHDHPCEGVAGTGAMAEIRPGGGRPAGKTRIEQAEGHGRSPCPTAGPGASQQFTGQPDSWNRTGYRGRRLPGAFG
jgi:hypothetical protein